MTRGFSSVCVVSGCPNLKPCPLHQSVERPGGYERGRLKARITAQQGGRCATPGCDGRPTRLDHVIRITEGGDNSRSNLQMLCVDCHDLKTSSGR